MRQYRTKKLIFEQFFNCHNTQIIFSVSQYMKVRKICLKYVFSVIFLAFYFLINYIFFTFANELTISLFKRGSTFGVSKHRKK